MANYNQNWNDQMGGNYYGFGNNNQGITSVLPDQDMRKYFSDSNQMVYPGSAYSPHRGFEEMQAPPFMEEPSGVGEGYDQQRFRDVVQDKFSKFTTPLMQILKSQKDNPEEAFGKKYFNVNQGRVAGSPVDNLYSNMNVSSGFGKGLDVAGQKRIDRLNKTISGWEETAAGDDLEAAEIAKQRLKTTTLINRRNKFLEDQAAYQAELAAQTGQGGTEITSLPTDKSTATGATYGGPPASDFNPSQAALAGGYKGAGTQAKGGAAAGPMSGAGYGPWSKRDGGRIGYQDGELVEQETDFIQGPQGGEEFQETVVEGQEQPSREQLEALAMEIFQLPLEELDEQQLLVVYQEAMQGQPMEEAVQEEDVQYAAQGGLAGLL